MNTTKPYLTSELEMASYLKCRGHKLLSAKLTGRLVTFEFEAENGTREDADLYFGGAEVSARELFQAHRSLRALIQQVKEHSFQIGSEKQQNESQPSR